MLSVLRSRLAKIVSLFNKQAHCEPLEDPTEEGGPWKQNLRELAKQRLARMGAEPIAQNEEIATFVNDLAQAAGDIDPTNLKAKRESDATVQNEEATKTKRTGDGTVQDIKAWYGESVGSWDPINCSAVDSIEQKRKTRPENHWFH